MPCPGSTPCFPEDVSGWSTELRGAQHALSPLLQLSPREDCISPAACHASGVLWPRCDLPPLTLGQEPLAPCTVQILFSAWLGACGVPTLALVHIPFWCCLPRACPASGRGLDLRPWCWSQQPGDGVLELRDVPSSGYRGKMGSSSGAKKLRAPQVSWPQPRNADESRGTPGKQVSSGVPLLRPPSPLCPAPSSLRDCVRYALPSLQTSRCLSLQWVGDINPIRKDATPQLSSLARPSEHSRDGRTNTLPRGKPCRRRWEDVGKQTLPHGQPHRPEIRSSPALSCRSHPALSGCRPPSLTWGA